MNERSVIDNVGHPTIVGRRYQLEEQLGAGMTGSVYRAEDKLNGDIVALKRIRNPADPDLRLLLTREFQALASLHHPNVIGVRDYGFDAAGHTFFTMDYLPQAQSFLEAGAGRPDAAKFELFAQLLRAMAYVHRRGVIHRDLKPNNVLVSAGEIRVLDFGLALEAGERGHSSGSLIYMAPEILENAPASPAADLYAAGMLAYELFTGHYPFDTSDLSALIDAILEEKPNYTMLPPEIAPIVERLLDKDATARYPTAGAVLADLAKRSPVSIPTETRATRESFLQAADFVGRAKEQEQLQAALDGARTGRGSAWLVGGESGVGKSRLLAEVRVRALIEGTLVLRGQAVHEGRQPYHLWRDVARWLVVLAHPGDVHAGALRLLLPDVEELLDRPVPPAPALDPKATQARLLAALTALLRRGRPGGAGPASPPPPPAPPPPPQAPLLLLLDDVQWAGDNSLAVLQQVTRLVRDLPILVVAGYQSDERPELPALLPEMTSLHLARLAPEAIAALSTSMLGETGQREEIVSFLERETEGNTFFIVEVVRALAEEAGQLDKVGDVPLPEQIFAGGIRDVVTRRLDRLPTAALPLLELAAIAGREPDLALLKALSPEEDVSAWLNACANAAVLDAPESRWQFAHNKLRNAVLELIPPEPAADLHRQVAEAIEKLYPEELDVYAARLAHHFRAAHIPEREYPYALRAGELAAAQYANTEALELLNRALELNEQLPATGVTAESRFTGLLNRVQVLHILGQREQEASDLAELETMAETLNDDRYRARAAYRRAEYAESTGDYDAAVTAAQTAIALSSAAEGAEAVELELRSHVPLAHALQQQGHLREAYDRLLEIRPRTADFPVIRANLLRVLGNIASFQGEYIASRTYWEESLPLYRQVGDRYGEGRAFGNLGVICNIYLLDYEQAQRHYEKAIDIFREVGAQREVGMVYNNWGLVACKELNYLRSLEYYERALDIARQIGDRYSEALTLSNTGKTWIVLGLPARAAPLLELSLDISREIGASQGESLALLGLIWVNQHEGNFERALDYQAQALELARNVGLGDDEAYALVSLGQIKCVLGQWDESIAAYEQALSIWQKLEQTGDMIETLAGLAEVYLTRGTLDVARSYVEQILPQLTPHNLLDVSVPFHVYWICYRTLEDLKDARASEVLQEAYALLLETANKLPEGELRESFLHNDPLRRELLALGDEHTRTGVGRTGSSQCVSP